MWKILYVNQCRAVFELQEEKKKYLGLTGVNSEPCCVQKPESLKKVAIKWRYCKVNMCQTFLSFATEYHLSSGRALHGQLFKYLLCLVDVLVHVVSKQHAVAYFLQCFLVALLSYFQQFLV